MNTKRRIVLITGGSEGLGQALARKFALIGKHVWLFARTSSKLEKIVSEIRASDGYADYSVCDVTSSSQVEKSFGELMQSGLDLELVVNNAGVWHEGGTKDVAEEEIRRVIDTNLLGCIFVSQNAIKLMQEQNSSGTIANIVSSAGIEPDGRWSIYSASKFGLRGFTDSLRMELANTRINVVGIYPAGISTEFFIKARSESWDPGLSWMMSKEDVADIIVDNLTKSYTAIPKHIEIVKSNSV